jgi:hypothetical protein
MKAFCRIERDSRPRHVVSEAGVGELTNPVGLAVAEGRR